MRKLSKVMYLFEQGKTNYTFQARDGANVLNKFKHRYDEIKSSNGQK